MRELLEKWAKLEPERCRLEENIKSFAIKLDKWWGLIRLDDLATGASPIQVQAAIQTAIISRGWTLSLEWNGEWEAWVKDKWPGSDLNSPAEALLSAYLAAIEA